MLGHFLDTFRIQGPSFNATKTHEHGTEFICDLVLSRTANDNCRRCAKFFSRPGNKERCALRHAPIGMTKIAPSLAKA